MFTDQSLTLPSVNKVIEKISNILQLKEIETNNKLAESLLIKTQLLQNN